MEWKLERTARPRVRSEEQVPWENVMRMLAKNFKKRPGSPKPQSPDHQRQRKPESGVSNAVNPSYSKFKRNFVKRLFAEAPVASSPLTTRWQQSPSRDSATGCFEEDRSNTCLPEASGSLLKIQPEKETSVAEPYKGPMETPIKGSFETNDSHPHFCKTPHGLDRGCKEHSTSKGQKCLSEPFWTQKVVPQIKGKMQVCEQTRCGWADCADGASDECFSFKRLSDRNHSLLQTEVKVHLSGLRNDCYLNILDWNLKNLVAITLGSSVYIWNGDSRNGIDNRDFSFKCNYVSSVSWIKEGTCLAVGTSGGEVQLWDVVAERRLRNIQGHLSVVGALSWNHCILTSGSRLGRVHHHDVRVARHHVGTLHHKQAVCALKWSADGRMLASGCSDGLLALWPHDPGVTVQSRPLKVLPQCTAVKAVDWCPWQSAVLAVGGGMEDGHLRILDINTGQTIQTPSTNSQICSLIWLPKTKEIATGQGTPKNDITVWTCPALVQSSGFWGHRGRVLHLALSPDQTRVFSAAADGTACVWRCC